MNRLNLLPLARTLLPVALATATFVACLGPNPTPGSSNVDTPVNGVPVGEVTPGLGTAGGNAATPPNTSTGGNDVGNANLALQSNGSLTLALATAQNLCLTASANPPVVGSGVVLKACSFSPVQRWWSENGRLHTDANLCLSNPSISQNSTFAAPTGLVTGNWVLPTLAACDANDLRQHVEMGFGFVLGEASGQSWVLSPVGKASAISEMVWIGRSPNDTSVLWTVAGQGNATATANGAADGNALAATGGFHIASVDSPNLCLDSNGVDAAGAPTLVTAPCVATAASQQWLLNPSGGLVNKGSCLINNNNPSSATMGTCSATAPGQKWQVNYGKILAPNSGCLAGTGGVAPGPVNIESCSQATQVKWTLGRTVK